MNERDELVQIIWDEAVADRVKDGKDFRNVPVVRPKVEAMADKILAAGYRKPRTITTAEELDALPNASLIFGWQGSIPGRTHKHRGSELVAHDGSGACLGLQRSRPPRDGLVRTGDHQVNALIVDRSPARAVLDRADAAYTQAVQEAVRTRDWGPVQAAAAAVHQARAALTHTEEDQ